jgi:hypothetical protein
MPLIVLKELMLGAPIAALIAFCGPGLPFQMVHGRLHCQACGSKNIHARPNCRGLGIVAKHRTSDWDAQEPRATEAALRNLADVREFRINVYTEVDFPRAWSSK